MLDRLEQASWDGAGDDAGHCRRPRCACFVGGREALSQEDQLRLMLREGCGFAIWFASGMHGSALSGRSTMPSVSCR